MSAHNRGYKLTTEYHFSDTHAVRETDYFHADDRRNLHGAYAFLSTPLVDHAGQRVFTADTGGILVGIPRFTVYQAWVWRGFWETFNATLPLDEWPEPIAEADDDA